MPSVEPSVVHARTSTAEPSVDQVPKSTNDDEPSVVHDAPADIPQQVPASAGIPKTPYSAVGSVNDASETTTTTTTNSATGGYATKSTPGQKSNPVRKNAPKRKSKASNENKFSPLELDEEVQKSELPSKRERKLTAKALELEEQRKKKALALECPVVDPPPLNR